MDRVGAHDHVMRGGGSDGPTPLHLRRIRMGGDMDINMKEGRNSTLRGLEGPRRGLKTPHAVYTGLRRIRRNPAGAHPRRGRPPAESAGAGPGRPDMRLTTTYCAADHDNACKLGEKPPTTDDPRRAGLRAIPLFRYRPRSAVA